ncbi:MAG: B12-binding domain-containing radical SAM protein [Proteobacteria bacterium]|nr:B12-binding domain-containing radical SAM protein [Pseudomonadota bacterium]
MERLKRTTNLYTHEKKRYRLDGFNSVAIWGAGELGMRLFLELSDVGINVPFYIDRNPPPDQRDITRPVFRFEELPAGELDQIDAIFLAFYTYRPIVRETIQTAGFNKPLFHFPNRYEFLVNKYLSYNHNTEEKILLKSLESYLVSCPSPLIFYGAGELCRYMLEHMPGLCSKIICIWEDNPEKCGKDAGTIPILPFGESLHTPGTVFLASAREQSLKQMRGKITDKRMNIVSLEDLENVDPDVIPRTAVYEQHEVKYPVAFQEIDVLPGQDMILVQPPGILLPMMFPNGLGYVHNILKRTGIRFQTLDTNIVFYHRYHRQRLLDRVDGDDLSTGQLQLADEPWDRENWAEWVKPEFLNFFMPQLRDVIALLVNAKPKIVGISVNLINNLFAKEMIKGIREGLPDTLIIVGGPDCLHHGLGPKKIDDFDYMIIGEAENSLETLINRVITGDRPGDIPGVVSRFDSENRQWTPAPVSEDLDLYGYPDYEWTDIMVYGNNRGNILCSPINTNRGCKWGKCRFCTETLFFRSRSPESVVDEIKWWIGKGYRNFSFNDSDANGDPEKLEDICREIIRNDLDITLVSQFRIDRRNTPEFFHLLKDAGFTGLVFGVDAWTDRLIQLQRKGYNMRIVEQNLRDCHQAGLRSSVNMVVGIPGETSGDIDELIENIIRIKEYIVFGQIATLQLLVGIEYYRHPEQYGLRFRGDRETIYADHLELIPAELWYSEEPYIDEGVRIQRMRHVYESLYKHGVNFDPFCENLIKKALGSNTTS